MTEDRHPTEWQRAAKKLGIPELGMEEFLRYLYGSTFGIQTIGDLKIKAEEWGVDTDRPMSELIILMYREYKERIRETKESEAGRRS